MSVDEGMVKFKGRLFFKQFQAVYTEKARQILHQGVDGSRF